MFTLAACGGGGEQALSGTKTAGRADAKAVTTPTPRPTPEGMVMIPGGYFMMGNNKGFAHEAPAHKVNLSPFYMDVHEVTNDQFAAFVDATHFKTEAEKFEWSFVFDPILNEGKFTTPEAVSEGLWWTKTMDANWRHPAGIASTFMGIIEGHGSEPVTQVSWNDATAYCEWAGKRLPTEAEWERAARGGAEGEEYPWGSVLQPNGKWVANIWQGIFPVEGHADDGFRGLAPVASFPPNAYGLYDMSGNAWEWCFDWYDPGYYAVSPEPNPKGPAAGQERVLRGGSWMCSPNYSQGYRVSHRNKATPDSGLNNMGFRCAMSLK